VAAQTAVTALLRGRALAVQGVRYVLIASFHRVLPLIGEGRRADGTSLAQWRRIGLVERQKEKEQSAPSTLRSPTRTTQRTGQHTPSVILYTWRARIPWPAAALQSSCDCRPPALLYGAATESATRRKLPPPTSAPTSIAMATSVPTHRRRPHAPAGWLVGMLLAAALLPPVASASSFSPPPASISLGWMASLNVPNANSLVYGHPSFVAFQLALADVNASPHILPNTTLRGVWKDHHSDSAQVASAAYGQAHGQPGKRRPHELAYRRCMMMDADALSLSPSSVRLNQRGQGGRHPWGLPKFAYNACAMDLEAVSAAAAECQ
jgi:hypothetical protein